MERHCFYDGDATMMRNNKSNIAAFAFNRLKKNASLRRALVLSAWRSLKIAVRGNFAQARSKADVALSTLTADVEGRIDVLATRHVSYLALVIKAAIESCAIKCNVYYDDDICFDYGQRFVVLCPHVFRSVPRHYAAFQLEQSVSSRWFTADYFERLQRAQIVLDYSKQNIEFLVANGVSRRRIIHLPIATDPDYLAILTSVYPGIALPQQKTIDVLFYGDPHSPRRKLFLDHLHKRFNLTMVDKVFGAELQQLISKAKIVANIHYYEGALLETTRLSEALSLGVPVVSEKASDQSDHEHLSSAVAFTNIDDASAMAEAIAALLDDANAYAEITAAVEALRVGDRSFQDAIRSFAREFIAQPMVAT
jgi:glycosyltransferase involved in cell wall biosynthesis